MNKYGKFEPSPKKMNSGKNPVKNLPTTLLNLDTIRFNDSDPQRGQVENTPFGVILESFRSREITDPSQMNDEQKELYHIRKSVQAQKYPNDKLQEEAKGKPDIRYYNATTVSKAATKTVSKKNPLKFKFNNNA